MVEFDPDAYLNSPAATSFDPDAYLKEPATAAPAPATFVPEPAIDPYTGKKVTPKTRAQIGEEALGLGSGLLQRGLGAVQAIPGETIPKAVKGLQQYGDPTAQAWGRNIPDAALLFTPGGILKTAITGGIAGLTRPSTQEDTGKRYGEMAKSGLTEGAIGAAIGVVTPLAKLLKQGYGLITGGQTRQEISTLATEALRVADEGKMALTQQERSLLQEQAKTGIKSEQATAAAEKVAKQQESSLSVMPGVKTVEEGGKFKPIPQTFTDVGNYIRTEAEKFLTNIKASRGKAADTNFTAAKEGAAAKEAQNVFTDTGPIIEDLNKRIAKGGSSDYLASLTNLKNDLLKTKQFEGLEIIRRRLGDAAFGAPEEGFKAIGQQLSGDMYKLLSNQMKGFEANFAKYLEDYKRLSQPIEVFGTRLGKALTETDASGRYVSKSAERIAKDVFSSPENYKMLVDAVGGNKQVAEAAARRYFAGALETAKTPEAVEKILRENRALFKEMPAVKKEIEEKYLARLVSSESRQASITGEITNLENVDKEIAAKLKNVSGAETLFSDAVKAITTAKPQRSAEAFESVVLPKIRQAEEKAGIRLISDEQMTILRQQMAQIDKISTVSEKARYATGVLAAALGFSGYKISSTFKALGFND